MNWLTLWTCETGSIREKEIPNNRMKNCLSLQPCSTLFFNSRNPNRKFLLKQKVSNNNTLITIRIIN